VRINRERENTASRQVKAGDTLTVTLDSGVRVLRVAAPGERRGPAPQARTLYEDLAPPAPPEPVALRTEGSGRPTKRDRRAIMSLKHGEDDFSNNSR